MADIVSFSNENFFSLPSAFLRVVFRYLQRDSLEQAEIRTLVSRELEFDAIGGWSFDDLSLEALYAVREALVAIEADLPDAISGWTEGYKPRFRGYLSTFKDRLDRHIEILKKRG